MHEEHQAGHQGAQRLMDAESKERARDYLAADILLTTMRLGGSLGIDRLPKETLRRARRPLALATADQIAKRSNARLTDQ